MNPEDLMDPIIALMPSFTVGPGSEFVGIPGSYLEGRELKILELSFLSSKQSGDAYVEVTMEVELPEEVGDKYWVSLSYLFQNYIPKEVLRDERD